MSEKRKHEPGEMIAFGRARPRHWPWRCRPERDVRLIAAAQEMLETLKWLARGEHEWSVPPDAIALMERAIAKAESL